MSTPLAKFQDLLRELFQFDCVDLDFGIYRIMNHKRDIIERFIVNDLPNAVSKELKKGAAAEEAQTEKKLQENREQVRKSFGHAAIDADGNLAEMFHNTPLGKCYLELKAKSAGGHGQEGLEAAIFNHLYAFFSRYYQDGDFISKRRYSKRQRYAIPYNGEEVHLHWANSDQYYVKTGEHFQDYAFTSRGISVHFKLQAADIEQDNVKGDSRFFLPGSQVPTWDEEARRLEISFEYRPLTRQEEITYGKRNRQETIITDAVRQIPKRLEQVPDAVAALMAERRKKIDGGSISFFEHHLRQYTKRNTSDFFIHKNLNAFLYRELDFYLKNEVLNLDQMEVAGEERSEGWFQMMQVIRSVGSQVIDFLDQIENFQKMLWEKRKFVIETSFCISLRNIADHLFADIAKCDAQWAEWKGSYTIDEDQPDLFASGMEKTDNRIEYLTEHPALVLDSKHFDPGFVDRLLGTFDDLDSITDGVLVHSDNWQALNLLSRKYNGGIKCAHIDPPYNTQTSGFLYKNNYQHSSWLTMMNNHIGTALDLLSEEGLFLCHIDENEYERLHLLMDNFDIANAGTMIWDKRNPMTAGGGVAIQHEYVIWRTKTNKAVNIRNKTITMMLDKANDIIQSHGGVTELASM